MNPVLFRRCFLSDLIEKSIGFETFAIDFNFSLIIEADLNFFIN